MYFLGALPHMLDLCFKTAQLKNKLVFMANLPHTEGGLKWSRPRSQGNRIIVGKNLIKAGGRPFQAISAMCQLQYLLLCQPR